MSTSTLYLALSITSLGNSFINSAVLLFSLSYSKTQLEPSMDLLIANHCSNAFDLSLVNFSALVISVTNDGKEESIFDMESVPK